MAEAGFRLFTLTNNLSELQTRQLEHAGLVGFFQRRFSADSIKHHQPSRQAYAEVERNLGVEPSQLCLSLAIPGTPLAPFLRAGRLH